MGEWSLNTKNSVISGLCGTFAAVVAGGMMAQQTDMAFVTPYAISGVSGFIGVMLTKKMTTDGDIKAVPFCLGYIVGTAILIGTFTAGISEVQTNPSNTNTQLGSIVEQVELPNAAQRPIYKMG